MTSLQWAAQVTGLTYNEINVIIYYALIPFGFAIIIDAIAGRHWCKTAVIGLWALITLVTLNNFSSFADTAFELSVAFLKAFDLIGVNYVAASVVICVILPAVIAVWLVAVLVKKRVATSKVKATPEKP